MNKPKGKEDKTRKSKQKGKVKSYTTGSVVYSGCMSKSAQRTAVVRAGHTGTEQCERA